jgi:hypothetical protein
MWLKTFWQNSDAVFKQAHDECQLLLYPWRKI